MVDPCVVVGGGLAGMAAAARLAKAGHPVVLYEKSDRLGGRWAAYHLGAVLVDDAPAVLGFPAPWRDLFRKSGRPLEAELARIGYRLEAAEPIRIVFGDETELTWPSDRGEQLSALTAAYGRPVAERWRDLVDRLDRVWQALRPLGWETELRDRRQVTADVRRRLLGRQSLARLARGLDHPHLAALVRSVAYRQGSVPERTPALAAVDLSLDRTFGRWMVQPIKVGDVGRSSVLIEALAGRLALRKVSVQLNTPVHQVVGHDGRIAVHAGGHRVPAAAVVVTVDPWQTLADLVPERTAPGDPAESATASACGGTGRPARAARPARHRRTGNPEPGRSRRAHRVLPPAGRRSARSDACAIHAGWRCVAPCPSGEG